MSHAHASDPSGTKDTPRLAKRPTKPMRGKRLAFTAFVARLESARAPKLVVRMRSAEPALALFAEQGRGGIAGFIQMRHAFAKRLGSRAGIFFGRLCLHDSTFGDILLLLGPEGDAQAVRLVPNRKKKKSS